MLSKDFWKGLLIGAGLLFAVLVVMSLTGCGSRGTAAEPQTSADPFDVPSGWMYVRHDDRRHVTCWIYHGIEEGGVSCLPDKSFEVQQ